MDKEEMKESAQLQIDATVAVLQLVTKDDTVPKLQAMNTRMFFDALLGQAFSRKEALQIVAASFKSTK